MDAALAPFCTIGMGEPPEGADNSMREVHFRLLGLGGVGATLLRFLRDARLRSRLAERAGLRFVPVLLADSRGFVADPAGLSDAVIDGVLEHKSAGGSLAQLEGALSLEELITALPGVGEGTGEILIDATASDQTLPALFQGLDAGGGVVLANKKPLAADWEAFERLTRGRRCRYEATVGAGLPIIATLHGLLDSGDEITSLRGCFSGTLGFLCSALNRGETYSAAVRQAHEAGYTEPDPRDDLCGLDVARKALILSRVMGRALELADLRVEPMIPGLLEGLSQQDFMRRLPEADPEMASMVKDARRRGRVLSYVADLTGEAPTVGLREVEPGSPIGRLAGADNIVVFHTARYNQTPLVIQGPGAGREVTAAGVLSDMISLAREGSTR